MKIAIQGHSARGHEVIQILESLGGKKRADLTGRLFTQYYFIHCNGDIDLDLKVNLLDYKFYTLEEFEKEFPYKIGDKVRDCSDDEIGTILGFIDLSAFINVCNELMYVVDFEKSGHANMPVKKLKPYTEMKEERNITLTLDKAREWYKKGGELKEIALQAFSEKELTKVELPKTWEEFCKNYPIRGGVFYIDNASDIQVIPSCVTDFRDAVADRNICPSNESAEAHLALIQLEQLRDCWWNGWEPIWDDSTKYSIKRSYNEINVIHSCNVSAFLVFPTKEMAKEFLECFKDLIEKAGDLI